MKLAARWNDRINAPELYDPTTGDNLWGITSIKVEASCCERTTATLTVLLDRPLSSEDMKRLLENQDAAQLEGKEQ